MRSGVPSWQAGLSTSEARKMAGRDDPLDDDLFEEDEERQSLIEELIRIKFGRTPFEGTDPDEEARRQYRRQLRATSPEALSDLHTRERSREKHAKRRQLQADARRREAARPFNRPEARADFEHWSKAATVTIDEAVALSFGKEPSLANWAVLEPLVGESPFAVEFARRRDLALRAELGDPLRLNNFAVWLTAVRLEAHASFVQAVPAFREAAERMQAIEGAMTTLKDYERRRDELAREVAMLEGKKREHQAYVKSRNTARKIAAALACKMYSKHEFRHKDFEDILGDIAVERLALPTLKTHIQAGLEQLALKNSEDDI